MSPSISTSVWRRQDIRGSKAHAAMLADAGIITKADAKEIAKGLDAVLAEIEAGTFKYSRTLEDVHMNVESRLKDMIGTAAGRLHTARSRNDQVATDFRLWVRDQIDGIDEALAGVQRALVAKAEAHAGNRHAGLHAFATGAAGDVRPSPAGLCRNDRPRSRPLSGCAQAAERKPARIGGAGWHVVPD